jgi:serine/threonine protein kinase/Tol biopolymer transport system component
MSHCFNPTCQTPKNSSSAQRCQTCGAGLLLRSRYRLLKSIGQGGFGQTFLAVDETMPSRQRCVVKQFLPRSTSLNIEKATTQFQQEAARLSQLGGHPQIPQLLAYIEDADRLYVVQSFVEGDNLAQELAEQGAFNENQVRQLLSQLLNVLSFIHDHQVIHRDIKPENVIHPATGPYVLVDFGAAKVVTGATLAKTGTLIGSASYAAPEQAAGKAIFASDLYSLGVTCLHVLTNISPFDLFDLNEGAWAWRDYLTQPISSELAAILDKMVAQGTRRRYQSATEVLQDLQALSAKAPRPAAGPSLHPVPPSHPLKQPSPSKTANPKRPEPEIARPANQGQAGRSPLDPSENARPASVSVSVKGICLRTLEGHSKPIHAVAYSPNGQQMASASEDGTVRLWQTNGGLLQRTFGSGVTGVSGTTGSLDAVAFSADGQTIAAAGYDGVIRLWRTSSGTSVADLKGHSRYVSELAFSADGQWLASAGYDNTLRLWKIDLNERFFLWHTIKAKPVHVLTNVHSGWVCSIAFRPDGQQIASAGEDGTVKIWQTDQGKLLKTLQGHEGMVKAVAFSPTGRKVASSATDKTLRIWDTAKGTLLQTITTGSEVNGLVFSRSGQAVASAQADCNIRLWQISNGQQVSILTGHSDIVHAIALSPDGTSLISGSEDKTVKLWSVKGF